MERKFFICEHCGNLVTFLKASGVPVVCCGQKMTELVPGTTDAAVEKHVPAVKVNGNEVHVQVGSVEHPMLPEHYIEFIWMETEKGSQLANLKPGDKPEAIFTLAEGDKVVDVYAHCNLHGLWKAQML